MKHLFALTTLALLSVQAQAKIEVVYGQDNRQDVFQSTNSLHKKLAQSTAGMISLGQFQKAATQGMFDLKDVKSLERAENICPGEKFAQQPIAAMCSGFLVGPDTLVTAGHCYKSFATPEQVCKGFGWVFGFDLKAAATDPTKNIPVSNVYLCKSIVQAQLSPSADFAVIKLDRAVVGREPLKFRTSGKVSNSTELFVIGHPTGLPTKISPAGKITKNDDPSRFSTTLDTFHGNSGSAVFDASTGMIEGILIQGKNDYIPSKKEDPKSCQVVNKCDENGNNCSAGAEFGGVAWGEVVLRMDQVVPWINQSLKAK